ncbi:MAG TPA: DNA repair protein RecN [Gammaproteobacteria bacterium]|nr:DNA repair protein RecN [Gammaproteobacteria bacterium]
MLISLHIRNFAIIDALDIETGAGMTALTGETGAGKSILLDALGLLLGDRADTGVVRHGAERAELSALFDIRGLAKVQAWLTERDLDLDGDSAGECQLRRVIPRQGRSRAYINTSPVPLAQLRELGEQLVDIHGQHEHQSLMQRGAQRRLLDQHGGHEKQLAKVARLARQWKQTGADIEALVGGDGDREARLDFLRFQLDELDELSPREGEAAQLHRELGRLGSAEQRLALCAGQIDALYEAEHSAHGRLGQALAELQNLAQEEPDLREACELLDNAMIQLDEAVDRLRTHAEQVERDPARQQAVEQRLDALHRVAAKHRIEPEALPAFHTRLREELAALEQADSRLEELERARAELAQAYAEAAAELHRKRKATARKLAREVTRIMQQLGMEGGRFDIHLLHEPRENLPEQGTDRVEFRVSANPGQPPAPLARVASGGELSRISLAIQVIASSASDIPTLVFDEVDAGIGGAVGQVVGEQLRALGEKRQVLCVTHLPQVAACARHHLLVNKLSDGSRTRTRVQTLDRDERIDEIARMLGGKKITETTRRHAREMLQPLDEDISAAS